MMNIEHFKKTYSDFKKKLLFDVFMSMLRLSKELNESVKNHKVAARQ